MKTQLAHTNALIREDSMSKQAKTLTSAELRRVLDYVATRKHAPRNRCVLLLTHYAGLRVGEAACLRLSDVVDISGTIKTEIQLTAQQTKGGYARTVYVNEKLRKELVQYLAVYKPKSTSEKLFYSQKKLSDGFSANTLTQFFHYLYARSGIDGASSHSGRRTELTNLSERGVGVRTLMAIAGTQIVNYTALH